MNQPTPPLKVCPRCRHTAALHASLCACGHTFRTRFAPDAPDQTSMFLASDAAPQGWIPNPQEGVSPDGTRRVTQVLLGRFLKLRGRWVVVLLVTIGLIGVGGQWALTALHYARQPEVQWWTDRSSSGTIREVRPICPHCRLPVATQSTVCPHCSRGFRWKTQLCPQCSGKKASVCPVCEGRMRRSSSCGNCQGRAEVVFQFAPGVDSAWRPFQPDRARGRFGTQLQEDHGERAGFVPGTAWGATGPTLYRYYDCPECDGGTAEKPCSGCQGTGARPCAICEGQGVLGLRATAPSETANPLRFGR